MPGLSERDLSSVEKFFNAMQAALAFTKKRHAERQQYQQKSDGSSLQVANPPETLADERRVWAETAFVFWRIASRQQTHLLSYITTDATDVLCLVCDGLLDYIHDSFHSVGSNASFDNIMKCASSLASDHIFFFLDAFCSVKSCISMAGGDAAGGNRLHAHLCDALVRRGHFHWMTRVFCAFCDAARQATAAKSGIPAASVLAVQEALRCLRHCCADSTECAKGLMYTEPRPLVACLTHGLRLRIAAAELIRPFVFEDAAMLSGNTETERVDLSRLPCGRQALAEFLANGRTHIYDEVCREALAIAITAAERAAAFDSPALITALCLIMELSSRAVAPVERTLGESNRAHTSGSGSSCSSANAALSMSGQVAMYENVLAALDALRRLLCAPGGCGTPAELTARREAVLQQLLTHDLAECVRLVLRYCPALVNSENTFLAVVCRFCIIPHTASATVGRTSAQGQLPRFGTSPNPHTVLGNESTTIDRGPATGLFTEGIYASHESPSQLSTPQIAKDRHVAGKSAALISPQTTSKKSLWKALWGSSTRGELPARANCHAAEDDSVPKDESLVPPTTFALSGDEAEAWWYTNKAYVSIVRAIVHVLNDAFMDTTMPMHFRLALCGYLTNTTMRTSFVFSEIEGRLVMRSFLQVLRFQLLCHDSQLKTPMETLSQPVLEEVHNDETLVQSRSCTDKIEQQEQQQQQQHEEASATEKEFLSIALAWRIAGGLWQAYHILHERPLSSEVSDLVELPIGLLRWVKSAFSASFLGAAGIDISGSNNAGELHGMLRCLFAHVMRLWLTGLSVADKEEDIHKRSSEVLIEVFTGLVSIGLLPVSSSSSGTVPVNSVGTEDLYMVSTRDIGFFSDSDSIVSGESEIATTTMLDASPDVFDGGDVEGTITALRDIFTILLQRNAQFLSVGLLEVLFTLLWAGDPQLLRLGRRCIISSLYFGDVYAAYAEVIRDAEPSLLVQLLPLFSSELSSTAISAEAKRTRRGWLFTHGCITAVITVLERVLRSPHDISSFANLIQQLFRFLSVFESVQSGSPHLADTQLTKVFADAIVSLEGAEYFILIAQAVLNAATSKYGYGRTHSRHEQTYGHFTLPTPNHSAEKPIFLELIPPLLCHAQSHAPDLVSNLISVIYLLLKATTNVRSDGLLEWVLKARQTEMLPYLELDEAVVERLPYMGTKEELQSFWPPVLSDGRERSEVRFNCAGGIVITLGEWPEKGFSISAYFRFEEIYSNMCLFEFVGTGIGGPPPSSLHIVSGDSVHILQDGKKVSVNENQALQGLAPRQWIHVLVVMSVVHTVCVYFNASKIGACSLPYFRPHSEVVINVGFVSSPIREALFSIGGVELWDEELTMPQVEAHLAATGYQPHLCKLLPCEVPRELSEIHNDPPINDRIARFLPYENGDMLLLNAIHAPKSYPIVAKLTGNYGEPPKNWIDFRALFISRGGLRHLLDWIGQSVSVDELERYVALACNCIRTTTTDSTLNFRTYMVLGFHLRTHAALVTRAICDSLIHLATTKRPVNDELHPVIINRLVFEHIFNDVELLGSMPVDVAAYLLKNIERMFDSLCRFAKHNATYVIPFRFVDTILNSLVYSSVTLPFAIRGSLISCVKQIMIACEFDPCIISAMATTAAVLTPAAALLPVQQTVTGVPMGLTMLPVPRFSQVRVTQNVACDITLMILRSLVECCGSSTFTTAFGCIVNINWFAVCTSRFADAACVVYATRLFLEALLVNADLRYEVMQHPAVIVEALSPHRLNEDLLLLLLSHSLSVISRIDVLSSKYPLLEQLDGILNFVSPVPDAVVAPIFSKLLTLHLGAIMVTPLCFRPGSVSTVMQRRKIHACRVYRYFNFIRISARLMISIYVKRLMRHTSEEEEEEEEQQQQPSSTLLSPLKKTLADKTPIHMEKNVQADQSEFAPLVPREDMESVNANEAVLNDKLTHLMRRHRCVWAALFVCIRFWFAIGRRRYRVAIRRMATKSVSGVGIAMIPATEANGTVFVLQTLHRLLKNPNLFASLTLSPYQIASLAIFGTYIQKDIVASRMEDLQRAQWSAKTPALQYSVPGSQLASDKVFAPLVLSDVSDQPLCEEVIESLSAPTPCPMEMGESKSEAKFEENTEENVEAKNNAFLCSFSSSSASSLSSMCSFDSARAEGSAKRKCANRLRGAPFLQRKTVLSPRSPAHASDTENPLNMDRRLRSNVLVMEVDEDMLVEQMNSCSNSMGKFSQVDASHASLEDLLRETAVDVLGCTIVSALHTMPVVTEWVGGQTYGSCGGLLFQVMLSSNAVSGGAEDTSTLTNFFMYRVLECVAMTDVPCRHSGGNKSKAMPSRLASMSDVFFFNVCRFSDLLVDMVSFNVMELSSISPYFIKLLSKSVVWPQRSQHQLRAQVIKSCIAVLNRPSLQEITPGIMNIVHLLLTHAMCPGWIMKDMLECLLYVLFRVYTSLPPTCMDENEATMRKNLAILSLRTLVETYSGTKELHKALSARTLTQRFSAYKGFTSALLTDSIGGVFISFEEYCRHNVTTVDTLMSGRPKAKADDALKSLLKGRSEYIKRIKTFNEVYTKTTELSGEHRATKLISVFDSRFSSSVGSISPIKRSQLHWLMSQECSFEHQAPCLQTVHSFKSRKNNSSATAAMASSAKSQSLSGMDPLDAATSNASGTVDGLITAELCEHQLNHISALVLPFAVRCRPYIDPHPPFVDQRCKVSPSAVTLLRYLLEPNEVVHFISNGFRINGIHATPCLILLTTRALKVIGFSRITENGDILLCHHNSEEDLASQTFTIENTHGTTKRKKFNQQTAVSFALSMTNKLQRFLTDDGRRKKETEARKDGTKVAQSVRQATGHSDRDLFWVFRLSNIIGVQTAYYMHQDTALLFDLAYDDGPLLSIVDAQQSMNTLARDELLRVLREVLGNSRCVYREHGQRGTRIRSMLIRWAAGSISTYDYLAFLNQMAGRTQKDFNQYPVYPWVLADYKSEKIALDSPATYRNLSLPMGAQTEVRQQAVKKQYDEMMEMKQINDEEGQGHHGSLPFHHGAHYSASGGVLYYLIRVEPFTTFARIFQGGDFDVATRLFDSIEASFQSCVNGPTDCKELTPEFFFNGAFLLNNNRCNFGEKSDGSIVNDVKLPPWAKGSAQVFTAVMRYVLESGAVVNNIHRWIDLIFGVRRRGNLAVESYNVFQRMTYGEEVIKALKETNTTHEINVIIAEVDNFGQTPMQLFQERHPAQRELEPIESPPSGGAGNASSGSRTASGQTYITAFYECTPRVLAMMMHVLDVPNMWFTLTDLRAGSFLTPPKDLCEALRINESTMLGFATTRTGEKIMCCYKHLALVDDTDYVICWDEGEHKLLRFDAVTCHFKSPVRYSSAIQAPMSVSAIRVGIRETLILLGSNNGSVCCLMPTSEDGSALLNVTLCHHTNPIAGFVMNEHYGRVISFTTTGTDFPIVWHVKRQDVVKLHRLDMAAVLPNVTPSERIVVAAFIDPRTANSIIITRRYLVIFDGNGDLFGFGALPMTDQFAPHLEDESGQVGFAIDEGTKFVANMTTVTTYNTLEWASGIQLILTGHQNGGLSLWRAVRLPPDKVEHGRIAQVEHHGIIIIGGDQSLHLGAITAIQQQEKDVPSFLVGFQNGTVKVLTFSDPLAEGSKTNKSV